MFRIIAFFIIKLFAWLYVRIDFLLRRGKQHDRISSMFPLNKLSRAPFYRNARKVNGHVYVS